MGSGKDQMATRGAVGVRGFGSGHGGNKGKASGCGCACGGKGHGSGHECRGACGDGCRCKALGRITRMCRDAMAAFEAGDFSGAEALLRQALDLGRDIGAGPVIAAKTRNGLGIVLHGAGRHAEARAQYAAALALVRDRVGTDNRLYGVISANSRRVGRAA